MTTRQTLDLLRAYESRNVTFIDRQAGWPVVWRRARGARVWDADGKRYLDLTAAFGVAAAGHANPRVVRAAARQMSELLHAMGDVHPHALKARLARELSRLTFERWARAKSDSPAGRPPRQPARGKTIFCNSGFEAVEAALKTAILATGKRGVIVFEGAYHGLGYGALNATHRDHFRLPFRRQLREFGHFVPFPCASGVGRHAVRPGAGSRLRAKSLEASELNRVEDRIERLFRRGDMGAVLVEPIQVRGGVRIPPPEFLPMLRRLCDRHGALLVLDEIYTGFGRTGRWFACEYDRVAPDLICLGKALTGGFPLSACVGRADVMDAAWPVSRGEAIHTSTFLGHPVGCAMALAHIGEIRRRRLAERSARLGDFLLARLKAATASRASEFAVRGMGLLAGVELKPAGGMPATERAFRIVQQMLRKGFIVLPEGEHGQVISFTPPLTITEAQLDRAVRALADILAADGTAA
jgi:4-aminobutyrate aminotransferase-like enzyme